MKQKSLYDVLPILIAPRVILNPLNSWYGPEKNRTSTVLCELTIESGSVFPHHLLTRGNLSSGPRNEVSMAMDVENLSLNLQVNSRVCMDKNPKGILCLTFSAHFI